MNNNQNKDETPEYLKGKNVDEKGLPLRMNFDRRRLDRPFASRGFKFTWDRFNGVGIVPNEE